MQSTWMVFASFKDEEKKNIPPPKPCSTFCLRLPSSQPRLQHTSPVLRKDLGHPSEITQPPQKAPRRGRLSGAQTTLRLLRCSQGHGEERLGTVPVKEVTCLPSDTEYRGMALPSQKLVFSPDSLLSQLQPQHGLLPAAIQGRALSFLFPRRERPITPCCLTLKAGSGQRKPRRSLPRLVVTFTCSSERV